MSDVLVYIGFAVVVVLAILVAAFMAEPKNWQGKDDPRNHKWFQG